MITPALIIAKKRDGKELAPQEIKAFIKGLSTGEVADYQATAFLMAVFLRGMTLKETVALTEAMLESGEYYDLSKIRGCKIDKHSTGGVGDKVSLILAPLAAACGLKVPMMSGRGLGHTGGTLDKLESIPGFNVRLDRKRFEQILKKIGVSMIGQTDTIAPADKKLYSLRDVTGTVECIPLIVASILSKKLAEGSEALVLDVKVGNGAFMKSRADARNLAKTLTQVAKKMGLRCRAVLTDMNQPLGYAAGNSLEMLESIEILRNTQFLKGELDSSDIKELTLDLCAHMLHVAGLVKSVAAGRKLAETRLTDGSAWAIFKDMVREHGGSEQAIENPLTLQISDRTVVIKAKKRGFITNMNTEGLGLFLVELGGGRKKVTDTIDYGVGMLFHKKLGAKVAIGEPIATLYLPQGLDQTTATKNFLNCITITGTRKAPPKLVLETLG